LRPKWLSRVRDHLRSKFGDDAIIRLYAIGAGDVSWEIAAAWIYNQLHEIDKTECANDILGISERFDNAIRIPTVFFEQRRK
jgi:hypothetical protein